MFRLIDELAAIGQLILLTIKDPLIQFMVGLVVVTLVGFLLPGYLALILLVLYVSGWFGIVMFLIVGWVTNRAIRSWHDSGRKR